MSSSSSSEDHESESAQADPDYLPSHESDDDDEDSGSVNFLHVLRQILSGRPGLHTIHTISTRDDAGQQVRLL